MSKLIISPIAIDLGAKNTGVYFAHYPAGSSLDEIEKDGKVYQLEKDSYTLLMANRTAARHQRRGYDRRQMAKRLFKLIWCKHFGLEWGKDVQQAVGFLLNRRGFSFLTEEYDADVLRQFPKEAFDELPDNLKIQQNDSGYYDFAGALTEWGNEGEAKVKSLYESLNKEPKRVRARLLFISRTDKLREYCLRRKEGNTIPKEKQANLSRLSRWILEEWIKEGVHGLPGIPAENTVDLVEYLNNKSATTSGEILHSLPSESSLKQKKSELKKSNWEFEPEKFQMGKANFGEPENPDVKAHLYHLAFAIHKIHDELRSGGRHRSKYFEEVKNVLKKKDHTHDYLKKFCGDLQSGRFHGLTVDGLSNLIGHHRLGHRRVARRDLTVDGLSNLIGHISNLELKPLSKYFDDKRHRKGDYWDESRFTRLFDRWILREWRVGEKDKDKADGGKWPYPELKGHWNRRDRSIVDFWLETPPGYTIPPYQDNNNRRPPRCQSLLLNVNFLNHKYGGWREWLVELKGVESVRDYLGDYEGQLKEPKSGKGNCYFSDERAGKLRADSGRRSMAELDARVLQFIFDRVKAEDRLNLNEIYSHSKKIKQDMHKQDDQSVKAVDQAKRELDESIRNSGLPQELKIAPDYGRDDLFPESSFFHLICKYYKLRQRARDGRIFIHPEYRYTKESGYKNTGRFNDKEHLLTYCNHKPRQKRYQMLEDLAKILFTTKETIKSRMGISDEMEKDKDASKLFDTVEQFFNDIKHEGAGLKGFMEDCAKAKKDYRGALKMMIDVAYKDYEKYQNQIRENREESGQKPLPVTRLKSQAKKKLVEEWSKARSKESVEKKVDRLIRLKEKSFDFAKLLAEKIHGDIGIAEREAIIEKFDNPFSLAQIYDIAYKERHGNSKTCSVCSADNMRRMDAKFSEERRNFVAKAGRLPAMPARVIDGAVMRMARIVGGAIAEDKWKKIEKELDKERDVYIPIVTESNRFEFEPSREELVKGQRPPSKPRKGEVTKRSEETDIFSAKEERIKDAGKGICPYCGGQVFDKNGEIDHIIPRRSRYGVLNDETNLVYAHIQCNALKGNKDYGLRHLSDSYKEAQFGETDTSKISQLIIEQIGDDSGENFEFGKYRSFINLTPNQQTAFRHALFLVGDPLREKVINAIDNKNRAFVNGTQRYFAEVLANELYKLAKAKRKEKSLTFDYFGVPADGDIDSVPFVRGEIENLKDGNGNFLHPELQGHKKPKGEDKEKKRQTPPSHLIDAGVAFMIAVSKHYKDGSFKINAPYITPYCYVGEYGEERDLYGAVKVRIEEDKIRKELVRVKPNENFSSHRAFTRDTYYADHYFPVLLKNESNVVTVRVGFDWKNSAQVTANSDRNRQKLLGDLVALLPVCEGAQMLTGRQYGDLGDLFDAMKGVEKFSDQLQKNGYCRLVVNKQKLHELWMEKYNTKTGVDFNRDDFSYKNLQYRTERVAIGGPEVLLARLNETGKKANKNFTKKVDRQNIILPAKKDWENCLAAWRENEARGVPFDRFLREYFKYQTKIPHQKVRKVFSLPVLTGQGKFMVRRKSWNGSCTYQIVNDSNSRMPDNKPNVSVRLNDGLLGIRLAKWAKSSNIVKFPSKENYQDGKIINPADWYAADKSRHAFPDGIEQIWYRIDDSTAPSIAVKLAKNGNQLQPEFLEEPVCQHGSRKVDARKETKEAPAQPEKSPQDVRNEFFEKEIKPAKKGKIICYKGKAYNAVIREVFRTATIGELQ